jgi:hypothetical protein
MPLSKGSISGYRLRIVASMAACRHPGRREADCRPGRVRRPRVVGLALQAASVMLGA